MDLHPIDTYENTVKKEFFNILEKIKKDDPEITEAALSFFLLESQAFTSGENFGKCFSAFVRAIVKKYQSNTVQSKDLLNIRTDIVRNERGKIVEGGVALLHIALFFRDLQAVKLLLKHSASINVLAYLNKKPKFELDFLDASLEADNPFFQELFVQGAKRSNYSLIDLLCCAANSANPLFVKILLKTQLVKNLNIVGKQNLSEDFPINYAIAFGLREGKKLKDSISCITLLLQYGASLDTEKEGEFNSRWTALHIVATCTKNSNTLNKYAKSFIALLIISGADRKIVGHTGQTAEEYDFKLTFVIEKTKQYWTDERLIACRFLEKYLDSNGNIVKKLNYNFLGAWLGLSLEEKYNYIILSSLTFQWQLPQEVSSEIIGRSFGDALSRYRLFIDYFNVQKSSTQNNNQNRMKLF